MGKKKEAHEKAIVACIKKHRDIVFIADIFDHYYDLRISQFYNLRLEESEEIREAINANRASVKHSMRTKWIQSDNPTLQITAFRLIADEDETRRLNNRTVDVQMNGTVGVVSEESVQALMDKLEERGV